MRLMAYTQYVLYNGQVMGQPRQNRDTYYTKHLIKDTYLKVSKQNIHSVPYRTY